MILGASLLESIIYISSPKIQLMKKILLVV